MTGIVACGRGLDGHRYVLADLSKRGTPKEWASAAVAAYHSLKADKIVIERNFGGEMAAATIRSVDPNAPIKEVTSSRGKVLRAEPIASVFEQKRGHIVGTLPELEDQCCNFTSDWNRARDGSPDRVDALVFALTELIEVRKSYFDMDDDALRAISSGFAAGSARRFGRGWLT
jgi:phage terminase large subunit-like protein